MILVSNPVFRKKLIEIHSRNGAEGLLDNKIQDGRRLKGKKQNYFIIHTIAIIVVSNATNLKIITGQITFLNLHRKQNMRRLLYIQTRKPKPFLL
jgi:hypothetical protein